LGELIGTVLHSFFQSSTSKVPSFLAFLARLALSIAEKRQKRKAIQKHHGLGKIIPNSLPIISRAI